VEWRLRRAAILCSNGGCPHDYTGSSESGGYIQQVQGDDNYTAALNTGGKFSQRLGYFEAQGQWPNDNNGAGDGADPAFFSFLTGMGQDSGTGFGSGQIDYEIDMMEAGGKTSGPSTIGSGFPCNGVSKLMGYYATVHGIGGGQMFCQVQNGIRLDQGLHTYGMSWLPDPNNPGDGGLLQFYFDGNPCIQVGGSQSGQAVPLLLGGNYATEGNLSDHSE
jgi:hypothetical protein